MSIFVFSVSAEKKDGCEYSLDITLHKKCPYSELFWSAFSCIRTEYGKIRSISLYSIRMRENADQNNSENGCFFTSDWTHDWNQLLLEIKILLLKELLNQWMTVRSPVKINTVSFKQLMTATLSVTKTDILLQRKDGCN